MQPPDPRQPIDPQINTAAREGLAGTTPANLYGAPLPDPEQVSSAPDGRPPHLQPAWRQDFPIDRPQDRHVERREFLKFMVLTSWAFVAGQVWIAAQNWLRQRRGQPAMQKIATVSDVPAGRSMLFTYPGETDSCVLVCPEPGVVVAYSQKCTHLSCAVVPRAEDHTLYCPCHNGAFDLRTGRPLSGPPRRPLPRVVLEVRGEDIYATGVELRTV